MRDSIIVIDLNDMSLSLTRDARSQTHRDRSGSGICLLSSGVATSSVWMVSPNLCVSRFRTLLGFFKESLHFLLGKDATGMYLAFIL